ncbi:MAG TPA: YciI family protein [Candidatus Limnocylindrales bacterium]|jgi:uncharacterized protein YciI
MAGEIPDGLAIEHVWVVDAIYGPDAAERRSTIRAEHLARMAELREAGTIIEVGGYADMSGSLILVRLPSEEAVSALVRADSTSGRESGLASVLERLGASCDWVSFRRRSG